MSSPDVFLGLFSSRWECWRIFYKIRRQAYRVFQTYISKLVPVWYATKALWHNLWLHKCHKKRKKHTWRSSKKECFGNGIPYSRDKPIENNGTKKYIDTDTSAWENGILSSCHSATSILLHMQTCQRSFVKLYADFVRWQWRLGNTHSYIWKWVVKKAVSNASTSVQENLVDSENPTVTPDIQIGVRKSCKIKEDIENSFLTHSVQYILPLRDA